MIQMDNNEEDLFQDENKKVGVEIDDVGIESLNLSVRSYNSLKRHGINKVSELVKLSVEELYDMRNMGRQSVEEVLTTISSFINGYLDLSRDDSNFASNKAKILHYVDERTICNEPSSIVYVTASGDYVDNMFVTDLKLSKRPDGILNRSSYNTVYELLQAKYEDVKRLRGMGAGSLTEILDVLKRSVILYFDDAEDSLVIKNIIGLFTADFGACDLGGKDILLGSIKDLLYKNKEQFVSHIDDDCFEDVIFLHTVYSADKVKNILKNCICDLIKEKVFYVEEVRKHMPASLIKTGLLQTVLQEMISDKKLIEVEDGLEINLPTITEFLEEQNEDNAYRSLKYRLLGKTLEETGAEMDITRERARQLQKKALSRVPILRENRFVYWYEKYDIEKDDFVSIFSLEETSYNYIKIISNKKGNLSLEELFGDERATGDILNRLQGVMKKYTILIKNEYVPIAREAIVRKLLEMYYSASDCEVSELYALYNRVLIDNGLADNEKLKWISERAFEARLSDREYILSKYGHKVRYYNLEEYDLDLLFDSLDLQNYVGLEISTLKLYRDNRELMLDYNILDEYELHNIMKKRENLLQKYNVSMERMPLLVVGESDRKSQMRKFLFKLAPIELFDFAKAYENEYGVKAETVQANFIIHINKFCHNSILSVDFKPMDDEEIKIMLELLEDDLYFIDDIKKVYCSFFDEGDVEKINSYNIKRLGFKTYSNYVIRDTYESADAYFTELILKNAYIDLKKIDQRIRNLQSFYSVLDRNRTEYCLLELRQDYCVLYDEFCRLYPGITRDDLIQFSNEVFEFATDDFFTVKLLKNKGFDSKLFDFDLEEWFYGAILRSNKKMKYIKTSGGFLFTKTVSNLSNSAFVKYVMLDFDNIKIDDLILYVKERYGLELNRYNLPGIVTAAGLSYDANSTVIFRSDNELLHDNAIDEVSQQSFGKTFEESVIEINADDIDYFRPIIARRFRKGFRLDSIIDIKRFRRASKDIYGKNIDETDEYIRTVISAMSICYNNIAYLPELMLSWKVRECIEVYIDECFSSGKKVVYYDVLYENFEEQLYDSYINNVDMLVAYLKTVFADKYAYSKKYLAIDSTIVIDIKEEVKKYLIEQAWVVRIEDLYKSLSNIPSNRIYNTLAGYNSFEFINNNTSEYFHADIVELSSNELNGICNGIQMLLKDKLYIMDRELIEVINLRFSSIRERYSFLTDSGIRQMLAYKLRDNFSFNGKVISKFGVDFSTYDVFAEFAKNRKEFTVQEIVNLRDDMGALNFEAIYDNSIRISLEKFVLNDSVEFDIERIDEAIDNFCEGDFIPLKEVNQFASFPYVSYNWNIYLLESYVYAYSKKYKLVHKSFGTSDAYGAIVKRNSKINNIDDLLVYALAESDVQMEKDSALNLFYSRGLLGKRTYQSIEQVIIKAKAIRDMKG